MTQVFRDRDRTGCFDFEALEGHTRDAVHRWGARVLEGVLEVEDGAAWGRACACGGRFRDHKREAKTVQGLLGGLRVNRTYQRCDGCGQWRVPQDLVLDVVDTGFSPGLRRAMAETAGEVCFEKAAGFIHRLAGPHVGAKDVERVAETLGRDILARQDEAVRRTLEEGALLVIPEPPDTLYVAADGTGVPVRRTEAQGRTGKGADRIARTREAKLGAVFTQTTTDKDGHAVRDNASTTYVGKIEPAQASGPRLYAEARCRGLEGARRVAVLGDGAPWIWNQADEYFPGATQIVDYRHAQEHLNEVGKALWADDEKARKTWLPPFEDLLWAGDIPALTMAVRAIPAHGAAQAVRDNAIEYFNTNRERMRYAQFREQGLFIGSGVVEAGCRSLIGERLKRSGMHWSVRGADAIIALRCCLESHRFEHYWEDRRPIAQAA